MIRAWQPEMDKNGRKVSLRTAARLRKLSESSALTCYRSATCRTDLHTTVGYVRSAWPAFLVALRPGQIGKSRPRLHPNRTPQVARFALLRASGLRRAPLSGR